MVTNLDTAIIFLILVTIVFSGCISDGGNLNSSQLEENESQLEQNNSLVNTSISSNSRDNNMTNQSIVSTQENNTSISVDNPTNSRQENSKKPSKNYFNVSEESSNRESCQTKKRYINKYSTEQKPDWVPEQKINPENLTHPSNMYEVTRYPYCELTEEQLDKAWKLYDQSYQAAKENGWFDIENAIEDGYRNPEPSRHYTKVKYVLDNESLNPEKPETLVYYESQDSNEKILVGYMYQNLVREGNQIGGPLTVWHYHPLNISWKNPDKSEFIWDIDPEHNIITNNTRFNSLKELYEEVLKDHNGVWEYRSNEMIHIWFARNPEGPFATGMSPELYSRQPKRMNESEFKSYAVESLRKRRADQGG